MHKYPDTIDPDMQLNDFLSLTYFQQWVVCKLYFIEEYELGEPKSADFLIRKACMSAMVDGFDTMVGHEQLGDLASKIMIEEVADLEFHITSDGAVLARNAAHSIVGLLDRPDFDDILQKIGKRSIEMDLKRIRDGQGSSNAKQTFKKIAELPLDNIEGFVKAILVLRGVLEAAKAG